MGNVLFVSSSPSAAPRGGYAISEPEVLRVREANDFGPLEVGVEVAEVRGELARVPGVFQLAHLPNASVLDMIRALVTTRFEIVHFSGHAGTAGLVLAGDDARYLSGPDLATLVGLGGRARLVVLNACSSEALQHHVTKFADFVIAMQDVIYDEQARRFSRALYFLLASGKSLQVAFDGARLSANESGKPKLTPCAGGSAADTYFARPARNVGCSPIGWGDCDVWVLERAGAEERQLVELLRDSMCVDFDEAARHLREGQARIARVAEDTATRRLRELRRLGALVTMARRWDGDDLEIVRDPSGLWFGALPSWSSSERAWLGLHPITRGQFSAVRGGRSTLAESRLPQGTLSLSEAVAFCEALTRASAGRFSYRLPTCAEWLAAARDQIELAATDSRALRRLGWFDATDCAEVGKHLPNERGFLDLLGNVAEWTSTAVGDLQQVCGGSLRSSLSALSPDWTELVAPSLRAPWLGFRVARVGGAN